MGWSDDVAHGKVVRLDSGGFVTTAHMRPFLVDSDELVALDPMEAHVPRPERRRLREKTSLKSARATQDDVEDKAKTMIEEGRFEIQDLCDLWKLAKQHSTPKTRTCVHGEDPSYLAVGQYTHGGFCGLLSNTYKYPHLTAYLTRVFEEVAGADTFAALSISDNVGMTCHRDVHNERFSDNIVVALAPCDRGGGIWVEASPEAYAVNDEWRQISNGEWRRGQVHDLEVGKPFRFNARLWHQSESWEGRRLVMIAYTPRMGAITRPTYDALLNMGFNPPPLQGPDFVTPTLRMMGMASEDKQVDAVAFLIKKEKSEEDAKKRASEATAELQALQDDVVARLHQRADFLAELLAEEEMLADELADIGNLIREEAMDSREAVMDMVKDIQQDLDQALKESTKLFLKAAVVSGEDFDAETDVEAYLEALEGDLGVTLTIPLDQVRAHLTRWVDAMKKELDNVETATGAVERITYTEARQKEARGLLRLVPGKMVFTVKPPPEPSSSSSSRMKWKRKARMVICGNYVGFDSDHTKAMLYASGASAESLRIALCMATAAGWVAAATDITGAFLLAKWPESKPTYGVLPPKVLVQCGLVQCDQVFLVKRPLYGLREAPSLWAAYRTDQLSKLRVPYDAGHLVLQPLISDTELWLILYVCGSEVPVLYGILVCYVDDLLYLALMEVVQAVHAVISGIWPCSTLEFAAQAGGLRYLGMELEVLDGAFTLSQRGYVENLVKSHGLAEDSRAALPCPKEWLSDSDFPAEVENFSEEELRQAQRLVGEYLWLSCRTRPDIVYITNYMASIVAKRPCFVAKIGTKVLSYLNASAELKLRMDGRSSSSSTQQPHQPKQPKHRAPFKVTLSGYSDASFSPFGSKSFGCSLAVVGQSPVAWKAGKQPYVTMSVCEAELVEGSTCALLLESIQAMLEEVGALEDAPTLHIDNQAAGNLLNGSVGSWRTRHLRVRFSYVVDRVASKELLVQHVPGDQQLADLPTKLHGRARLLQLLELWGMLGLPELSQSKVLKLVALSCVLCLMLAAQSLGVMAAKFAKEPLPSTGAWELTFVLVTSSLGAIACWEVVKWLGRVVVFGCCGSRRTRELRRLREMARLAAESEIERHWMRPESSSATLAHHVQQAVETTVAPSRDFCSVGVQTEDEFVQRTISPPRVTRAAEPRASPGAQSSTSTVPSVDDDLLRQLDRERLCKDVVLLMSCESIKQGLRLENLSLSGLKPEIAARLALRLIPHEGFEIPGRTLPTDSQLRYVLWLWRHRKLQMRCALTWQNISTREGVSRWLYVWKEA